MLDILGRMQAVQGNWNKGANTYVTPLTETAPAINHIVNSATHLTINAVDFRASIRNSLISGDTEDEAFNKIQNLDWHVTIELYGANHADNPRYYSANGLWVNLPEDFDVNTLQNIVDEGAGEMNKLHS
ncbi:MAG: hypothetical protein F6J87_02685 [Spirulina sp. SIO3F2]|nr:hypothetical protein [Spirulina sp. SIO3F2]